MNRQELISVIIPVYKAEEYLPACLDSVLAQTYQNLEVILVDDGSPDRSGDICDGYAARDPRVRVIHQENGGASAARNAGLDAAKGAYIGFVDADDYSEPNMYQTLWERLREAGADMALCAAVRREKGTAVKFGNGENGVFDGHQFVEKMLTEPGSWWLVTGKLCRAGLLRSLRFREELRIGEDTLLNAQLFLASRRVVFVEEPLYHWIWRPSSLSAFDLRHVDNVMSSLLIWREIERKFPPLSGLGCRNFAQSAIKVYERFLLDRGKYDRHAYREAAALIRDGLCKVRPSILKTPEVGRTLKIKTCLITLAPRLYNFLFPLWLKATKWRRHA